MVPQPCSPTESHGELRKCKKAFQLNRHCAPGLRLIVCVFVFVFVRVNVWKRKSVLKQGFLKRCYRASRNEKERWWIVGSDKKEGRDKKRKKVKLQASKGTHKHFLLSKL